jgi:hypothetical protein
VSDEPIELELYIPGEKPKNFLVCATCFIKDSCPLFSESKNGCSLEMIQKKIDIYNPQGLQEFVMDLLSIQSQRIMRLFAFEEIERGGLPSEALSVEIERFMDLLLKLKKLMSKGEFELFIRASGDDAGSIMKDIMRGIKDDS